MVQETRGITEKTERTTRKRITKRRRRRSTTTRPVETREPIGGRRCRTDADLNQRQCLFWTPVQPIRSVLLLFLKGIIAAIQTESHLGKLGFCAWRTGGDSKHCRVGTDQLKLWKRTESFGRRLDVYWICFPFFSVFSHLIACLVLWQTENVFLSRAVFCIKKPKQTMLF